MALETWTCDGDNIAMAVIGSDDGFDVVLSNCVLSAVLEISVVLMNKLTEATVMW